MGFCDQLTPLLICQGKFCHGGPTCPESDMSLVDSAPRIWQHMHQPKGLSQSNDFLVEKPGCKTLKTAVYDTMVKPEMFLAVRGLVVNLSFVQCLNHRDLPKEVSFLDHNTKCQFLGVRVLEICCQP